MSFFAKFLIDSNLSKVLIKRDLEQWKDGILMNISAPLSGGLEKTLCDILNGGYTKDSAIKILVVKSVDGKVVFALDTLKAIIDQIPQCFFSRSAQLYKLYHEGFIDEPQTHEEGTKDSPFVFTLSTPFKCSSYSSCEKI